MIPWQASSWWAYQHDPDITATICSGVEAWERAWVVAEDRVRLTGRRQKIRVHYGVTPGPAFRVSNA